MAKVNIISRLSDSKTRSFVILFGAIVLIGVVIALMNRGKSFQDELSKQGSVAVGIPDDIRATPGNVASEKYRELQLQQNIKRSQEALEKKESAIPTIIGSGVDPTNKAAQDALAIDQALKNQQKANLGKLGLGDAEGSGFGSGGFGQGGAGTGFGAGGAGGAGGLGAAAGLGQDGFGRSARDRERELQERRLREQREALERQRAEQERLRQLEAQRRLAEQQKKQYEAEVTKTTSVMKSYASVAYSEWAKFPTQAYVQGSLADKPFKRSTPDILSSGDSPRAGTSPQARELGNVRPSQKKVFIKAGTIFYGVMDTAVNSDEEGPILVTLVSGKYRGGKLMGTFTHQPQQESVIMNFKKMTVPKRAKSITVEVVAIDPETARTALATDVDKHYILRYGTLFAASFMQGYGQAITQAGTTTTSPLTGTTTTTTPELSGREQFLAALGEVGKQWANAVKPYFNTPYTVTVDQGTSVGLLFMSDVDVTDDTP